MSDSTAPARRPRDRRSPVETLLAEHPGDVPLDPGEPAFAGAEPAFAGAEPAFAGAEPAFAGAEADFAGAEAAEVGGRRVGGRRVDGVRATGPVAPAPSGFPALAQPSRPAVEDVALGLVSVLVEGLWRAGGAGLGLATSLAARVTAVLRAVSPSAASSQVDALVEQLAVRGRRVRHQRSTALSEAVNAAIMGAATSDAVRELAVAALEEASDDMLAVVMPAILDALADEDTEAALDDLMAGLLTRQLPGALERTIPTVLMRTATRPTQYVVPFLGGVLPKG